MPLENRPNTRKGDSESSSNQSINFQGPTVPVSFKDGNHHLSSEGQPGYNFTHTRDVKSDVGKQQLVVSDVGMFEKKQAHHFGSLHVSFQGCILYSQAISIRCPIAFFRI